MQSTRFSQIRFFNRNPKPTAKMTNILFLFLTTFSFIQYFINLMTFTHHERILNNNMWFNKKIRLFKKRPLKYLCKKLTESSLCEKRNSLIHIIFILNYYYYYQSLFSLCLPFMYSFCILYSRSVEGVCNLYI